MPPQHERDNPVDLVLGALAVHRLTRLVTTDEVTQPLRDLLDPPGPEPLQEQTRLGYFVTCPWCVSMWVAGGWLLLRRIAPRTARAAGAVLASSSVAGMLASWE